MSQKKSQKSVKKSPKKSAKKSAKKSVKKSAQKSAKKRTKKGPKNVSIFETFLVPKTRQKGYTLLTRFDVDVITTTISISIWICFLRFQHLIHRV